MDHRAGASDPARRVTIRAMSPRFSLARSGAPLSTRRGPGRVRSSTASAAVPGVAAICRPVGCGADRQPGPGDRLRPDRGAGPDDPRAWPRRRSSPRWLDDAALKRNMATSLPRKPPDHRGALRRAISSVSAWPAPLADLVKLLGSQVTITLRPRRQGCSWCRSRVSIDPGSSPRPRVTTPQDENFRLKGLARVVSWGDASLAHLAVAEGDATR